MIYTEDNFLPHEEFIALKNRAYSRFTKSNGSKLRPGDDPVRITHHGANGDWLEGCRLLGPESIPAVEKMIKTLEKLGIENIENWSVWFQYLGNDMDIPVHCDQPLRRSTAKNTFTCALYLSDWHKELGGEWISGSPLYEDRGMQGMHCVDLHGELTTIEPIPNRLLIWSRDVWHKVTKVTSTDPDYKRVFLGTGWSSVNDSSVWQNVH